jgi:hypothetical protein
VAIGQAKLRLALDGVSGPAMGVLAATLSPNGILVSFAAMSEGPMSINRSTLSSNLSDARLLAGPLGNCRQNWPSNRAGGGDDRLRRGAHTSGRDLPHLLDQTGCRACATGRKNPSGRCRIVYVTSESYIRYGHHNQWDGHWEFPRGALPEGLRSGLVRAHMKLRRSGVRVEPRIPYPFFTERNG